MLCTNGEHLTMKKCMITVFIHFTNDTSLESLSQIVYDISLMFVCVWLFVYTIDVHHTEQIIPNRESTMRLKLQIVNAECVLSDLVNQWHYRSHALVICIKCIWLVIYLSLLVWVWWISNLIPISYLAVILPSLLIIIVIICFFHGSVMDSIAKARLLSEHTTPYITYIFVRSVHYCYSILFSFFQCL